MTNVIIPRKYTNLHAHSTFSVGDALGLPQEHIDFALKNGMDSLALTDHGSMNGISHQQLHLKKLKGKGVNFKGLLGVELYFLNSLNEWKILYEQSKTLKAEAKASKKLSGLNLIGNELADTIQDMDSKHSVSLEEEGGTVVEVESESKASKYSDPLSQRNHLVVIAKNNTGLKSLFQIVSESYIDGFYRYPRVDFDSLRRHAKGNLIASTACIAGPMARIIFDNQDQSVDWNDWNVNRNNFDKIQSELKVVVDRFIEALGEENFFLELQMNRLPVQHLVNMHLIELSKKTNSKLIVTADSHYSNPSLWREREIYKAMAWASKTKGTFDPETLPKKIDDLKSELYPKNAEQIWKSYQDLKLVYPDLYDDQTICDAIERTHDIAHNLVGDVAIDDKIKLPKISRLIEKNHLEELIVKTGEGATEDDIAFKELVQLGIKGLRDRKFATNQEYIQRLKYELEVIKHLKFSKYFLTYYNIMKIVGEHMLIGNGRGSAAGSLLSYVLNITQVDPIRFGLLFERFLSKGKKCLLPCTYVMTLNENKMLKDLNVGDLVYTHTKTYKPVMSKEESLHNSIIEFELEDGTILTSSPNHLWIVNRNGQEIEIKANEIKETDEFIKML